MTGKKKEEHGWREKKGENEGVEKALEDKRKKDRKKDKDNQQTEVVGWMVERKKTKMMGDRKRGTNEQKIPREKTESYPLKGTFPRVSLASLP